MGDAWARSAVLAAARPSHGPPRVPPAGSQHPSRLLSLYPCSWWKKRRSIRSSMGESPPRANMVLAVVEPRVHSSAFGKDRSPWRCGPGRGRAGTITLQHLCPDLMCHKLGAFTTTTYTGAFLRQTVIALIAPCHLQATWRVPECHQCHQRDSRAVNGSRFPSPCCEGSCGAAGRAMKGLFRFRTHLATIQSLRQGLPSVANTTSCCRSL